LCAKNDATKALL